MSRLYKHLQDARALPKADLDHIYEYIPLKTSNGHNWKLLSFLGGLLASICFIFVSCHFIFVKKTFASPKEKLSSPPIESVVPLEDDSDYFVFVDPHESKIPPESQQTAETSLACLFEESAEAVSVKEDIFIPPTNLASGTQKFPSFSTESIDTPGVKKEGITPWNRYWGSLLKDTVYAIGLYCLEEQQTMTAYISHSLVFINALADKIKEGGEVLLRMDFRCKDGPTAWNFYWGKTLKNIVSHIGTYFQSNQLTINKYLSDSIIAMDEIAQNTARRLKLKDFYKQGTWVSFNLPIAKTLNELSQSLSSRCDDYFEKISKTVGLAQQAALNQKLNANQYLAEAVKKEFEGHQLNQTNSVNKVKDKHLAAVHKVLRKLKIYSVSIDGNEAKVNLNGNIYYPHTFVSQSPKLQFVGIEKNRLVFRDEHNKKFHKRISNE